jgi:uncharacterized protein (TIGR02001 family)
MKTFAAQLITTMMIAIFLASGSAHADNGATPTESNAPPAKAATPDDSIKPVLSFSLTGATNYIFRGISQTDNNPAIFGKAMVSYQDFYVGVGGENVDFSHRNEGEYDLSAGWKPTFDDFNFDLGMIRYGYIDQPAYVDADTDEFKAAVSHAFGPAHFGAAVFYTPNYFATDSDGIYSEANVAYKIIDNLSASAAIGRQHIGIGGSYDTWNIGGDYSIIKSGDYSNIKNVVVDLRYYDTDENHSNKLYGNHIVAAIKASF